MVFPKAISSGRIFSGWQRGAIMCLNQERNEEEGTFSSVLKASKSLVEGAYMR